MKLNLFVPAAGLGERLRPITDHIPKPLLPILGKPVIERVLERFTPLQVEKIGINTHYKADQITKWAEGSPFSKDIVLFHEKKILGTGGALKNASGLLGKSVFIVHNADIISDIDIPRLLEAHMSQGNLATLAVHDHPEFSNVWLDDKGRPTFIGRDAPARVPAYVKKAFTGIAVYSPEFPGFLPDGESSVVDAWLIASESGARVGTLDVTGCRWTDIGTPQAYAKALFDELAREGETVYIGPEFACDRVEAGLCTVIENGSEIVGRASLERAVLLPGCIIEDGAIIRDCIAGPGYNIDIPKNNSDQGDVSLSSNSLFLNTFFTGKASVTLIGQGGSDRKYYRLSDGEKSLVLMKTSPTDPDFERQIALTGFLKKRKVPVPELIYHDQISRQALFEDLGDISLYTWLKGRCDQVRMEDMFRKVLDILVQVHTSSAEGLMEDPAFETRVFDYDHLRWETDYFIDRFARGTRGIETAKTDPVFEEFDRLAKKVDSFDKTLIHRDFQSQNIMIGKDGGPRLIDYQGARIGPPGYDLVSMLYDPYYRLADEVRSRLLDYYMVRRKETGGNGFDTERFRQTLLPCSLQRHMQALGAYGYLSKEKGKAYFLKFVPNALSYLRDEAYQAREEYPHLYKLVVRLCETP
ncbi:MAG: phosphotransferase [Nitrospirae bacterium]|nr:phosphotransferase [Nitrospirota bacterium]